MDYQDNRYLDLTTYPEIYREMVYQRNEAIRWLQDNKMLTRNRRVMKDDKAEWGRHTMAMAHKSVFRENIIDLINRLYSHDAREALYDFEAVDLEDWSDTHVNRLERELQRLQLIIGKLEQRYNLQYQLIISYESGTCTLSVNGIPALSCGQNTTRHRLLDCLYSQPREQWKNDMIAEYFHQHFDYEPDELKDKTIEKAANNLRKDVAAKTAIKDFLIVSNAAVKINPFYLR